MSGLITTRPVSMAAAISAVDQAAHCSSSVMTSSSTHEWTRAAGRIAAGSLATEQRHDLVSAHAGHVPAGGCVAQPQVGGLPPVCRASAATALGRGQHDTVSTPSMLIGTMRMRRRPRPHSGAAPSHDSTCSSWPDRASEESPGLSHERCFRRSGLVGLGGREPVAEGDVEGVEGGLPPVGPPLGGPCPVGSGLDRQVQVLERGLSRSGSGCGSSTDRRNRAFSRLDRVRGSHHVG